MRHLHLPPTPCPGGSAPSPPAVPEGHPRSLGPEGRGEPPQRDTLRAELGQRAGWVQGSMAPGRTPFLKAPEPRTLVKRSQLIDTLSLMSQTDPLPNSVLYPKIFLDSGSFSLLNLPNQALVMFHYLISLIQALPVVIIVVVLCFLSFSSLFCSSHCSQNDCFKR